MIRKDFTAEQIRMLNKKSLEDMYCNQHLSTNKIAEKIGVGANTICDRLDFYQIPKRPRGNK